MQSCMPLVKSGFLHKQAKSVWEQPLILVSMLVMQNFYTFISQSSDEMEEGNGTHAAIWEGIDLGDVLRDRDTGKERGGHHKGLHLE